MSLMYLLGSIASSLCIFWSSERDAGGLKPPTLMPFAKGVAREQLAVVDRKMASGGGGRKGEENRDLR